MTWQEFTLSLCHGPVVLFSTATTGVNHSDNLLAVSWCKLNPEGEDEYGTFFHSVPAEEALIGAQYHKITVHNLSLHGLETQEFIDKVHGLFEDADAFSYNPSFQLMALNAMSECDVRFVYDLAHLTSCALNHRAMSADDVENMVSLQQLMGALWSKAGSPPPFKRVMKMCNINVDPESDELPVVTNVRILRAFWDALQDFELVVY